MTVASVVPNGKVAISPHHIRRPPNISGEEIDELEVVVGNRIQEQRLDARTSVARQEITNLGDDRAGDQEGSSRQVQTGEQLDALVMVSVVHQRRRDDWPGAANDHAGRPKPSSSSSSARSATSARPARPDPKDAGGHVRPDGLARCSRAADSTAGTCSSGRRSTNSRSSSRSALTCPA